MDHQTHTPQPSHHASGKAAEKNQAEPAVTLVDYFAPWCGPCRAMDPFMPEVEAAFAGKVKFEKVNVDEDPERSNAAGVLSIPTLHIIKNGKIMQTLIGFQSKEDLTKHLNDALNN